MDCLEESVRTDKSKTVNVGSIYKKKQYRRISRAASYFWGIFEYMDVDGPDATDVLQWQSVLVIRKGWVNLECCMDVLQ